MTKRTGPSNIQLRGVINLLRKASIEQKKSIWKRIAEDLEKPTRKRRIINLYKLDKHTKNNEYVIVPGKVLGTGNIKHKLVIAAWSFSDSAKEKIAKANGSCISIMEMLQKNPKAQNLRIMG